VGLKEQALHLAAFGLLLALNLVEGEFEGAAGGQPGLKQSELDSGGCGPERRRLRLSYSYGIITVRIMPQPRTSNPRPEQSARTERHAQRFHELKRDLDQLEYFCKGTVLKRMMKCGKAHCACALRPHKRHGPYFELTYKANGKTVNVKLSPEAAPLYKAASLQYRKLKTLLTRLEKLSQTILRHQAKLAQSQQRD
jgi:hypothetical protein